MKKHWNNLWLRKKIDDKEALELKKICNHYLDQRKGEIKKTHFKLEDVSGDILNKDFVSPEQNTKLKTFSTRMLWTLGLV